MDDARLNFYRQQIITGTPAIYGEKQRTNPAAPKEGSFQEILQKQISESTDLSFSKHAASRVEERGIDVSESKISRLSEGVKLAGEKGLDDTLILIDKSAFLVNVKNRTVITAVSENELKGNVFTNIDGTVIV